ncbi:MULTISPECIES: hypothetical protein [unclassified Actinopolyspora]|uniref:hypothetical protein n=1 Tax=Actinopolyspora TaxID=1849 RepID=UPI0013F60301|nr:MULTISPECIES: hypothetical protein [unclassified Actinopolyspora]NHD15784.1 hypothetical protein [Actinopolyspora sp. BKK2]NHE75002.1 hypothetical protein [Actinopolyspora sp. BKK1]
MDSTRDSSSGNTRDSGDAVEVCDLCGLSVDRDNARYERVGGSAESAPGDVLTACSEDHMRQLRERQ